MKRTRLIGLGLLLGFALALLLLGGLLLYQQLAGQSGFDVQGRVAGFGDDARTVIIEHEEVPGYMPPMTMPFTATDTAALNKLRVGDAVGFRLNVASDSSWITDLRRLPDSAVAKHPAASTSPQPANRAQTKILAEGDTVPDFTLATNQSGKPVHLSDYRGQALVLTFIYTRCPLPDFCPRMSEHFARLQERLPDALRDRVHLLSVSFDPEHDTTEVLHDYAQRYDADLDTWTFATGTPEQVERIAHRFGVFTKQENDQITHNLRTVLVGPDGRVERIWNGSDWQPGDVLAALRRTLPKEAG